MTTPMSDERLAEIRAMRWTETSRHWVREFRDEDEKFLWTHGAAHYNARVELVAEVDRLRAELADRPASYGALFAADLADAEARGSHLPAGRAWHQTHPDRYDRIVDGAPWKLEDCAEDEIGPDDPGPGWYLYGPAEFAEGRFVSADSDTVPIATADAAITAARLQARCTAEYGGPGYTSCSLPAGHDGHHTAPLGTMRTARWATNRAAESGGAA